jgi:hypothetical protein
MKRASDLFPCIDPLERCFSSFLPGLCPQRTTILKVDFPLLRIPLTELFNP